VYSEESALSAFAFASDRHLPALSLMSGFRPPPLALNGGDDPERAAHAQDPMTPRRMPLPPSASSAYMSKGQGAATPTAEVPSLGYDHNPVRVRVMSRLHGQMYVMYVMNER
jgi:hypothetical protein